MAHHHSLYMLLADCAAQAGDQAGLRQYAPRLEEAAAQAQHKLYQAIAHRAWGVAHRLAGEYSQAEARLTQALELFGRLETRWQIGRTHVELAALAESRAEPAQARAHLTQAAEAFEALEAAPALARTRAALQALGA